MQNLRIDTISSLPLLVLSTPRVHRLYNCRILAQRIFAPQEMALPDHFRLNTGSQIPGVGLGKCPPFLRKRQIESVVLFFTVH